MKEMGVKRTAEFRKKVVTETNIFAISHVTLFHHASCWIVQGKQCRVTSYITPLPGPITKSVPLHAKHESTHVTMHMCIQETLRIQLYYKRVYTCARRHTHT